MAQVDSPSDNDLPTTPAALMAVLEDEAEIGVEDSIGLVNATLGPEWSTTDAVLLVAIWRSGDSEDLALRARTLLREREDTIDVSDLSDTDLIDKCCALLGRVYDEVPPRLDGPRIREAVAENKTLLAVSQDLRMGRTTVRKLLSRLGLRDEVSVDVGDLVDELSEATDDADDQDEDDEDLPVWKRQRRGAR